MHGQDEAAKERTARYLNDLTGTAPIILHEQANEGRTIIEKFEDEGGGAHFAVVLLTGDDKGGPSGGDADERRARQNVIFELGYFVGRLGRSRVAVLYEDGVRWPSDISGIAYINLDGEWKIELARELKQAGFQVDLNRTL